MLKNRFLLPLVVVYFLLSGVNLANAAGLNLKKVNILEGDQVELVFDGKVDPSQVKTEFVRDNIQLSILNTSVYPAKVSMLSGSELTKVFAYQYSPALVRARFTVKGDAAGYANRLQVKMTGKTVTLRIAGLKGDQVQSTSSSTLRTVSTAAAAVVEKTPEPAAVSESSESAKKNLLERVTAENDKTEKGEKAEKAGNEKLTGKISDKSFDKRAAKTRELASGKSLPSPFRSIGVMLFVLGLFGLFVMFLKRLKSDGKSAKIAKGGLGGFLNKLSGSSGGKAMIEVVATHHLAPKRSIVVVRVQDRMLVLGMTNDAVNLITEFKANDEGEAEENIGLGDFAASLKKFENEEITSSGPSTKLSPKANLGEIVAAGLGLAKARPASAPETSRQSARQTPAPKASAAASAYLNAQAGPSVDTASLGGPAFSPAIAAALREPSVKPSIRAQIKDRVQGMKQL
ncbi:MAG: flagellar biosynthetic protein FliO [Cryobacterium sp.]|nr:flagellar biosynthetic protein FliO [Oligoflexia bacterium]